MSGICQFLDIWVELSNSGKFGCIWVEKNGDKIDAELDSLKKSAFVRGTDYKSCQQCKCWQIWMDEAECKEHRINAALSLPTAKQHTALHIIIRLMMIWRLDEALMTTGVLSHSAKMLPFSSDFKKCS